MIRAKGAYVMAFYYAMMKSGFHFVRHFDSICVFVLCNALYAFTLTYTLYYTTLEAFVHAIIASTSLESG